MAFSFTPLMALMVISALIIISPSALAAADSMPPAVPQAKTVRGTPVTTFSAAPTPMPSKTSTTSTAIPDPSQDAFDNWFCRSMPRLRYLTRGPGRTLIRIPQLVGDPRKWSPSPALGRGIFEFGDFNTLASCGYPGMLALTMDDGPHPVNSHRIMDYLAGAGFHATFFWMGWSLEVHTEVAQRALREGHHLASHTWGHPDLTTLTMEQLDKEIKDTERVISQLLGGQWRPRYMRPPYGSVNLGVMRRLRDLDYQAILWDFDTSDWRPEVTPSHIRSQYAELVNHDPSKESFITLQHDVHAKTVHVAAHVYEQVKAAGFTMVPMYVCMNEPAYSAITP